MLAREKLRAKRAGLLSTLTLEQWMQTLAFFSGKCAYCLERPYQAMEHFIPLRLGGGTTFDNCIPACKQCNSLKQGLHPNAVTSIPKQDIERVYEFLQSLKTRVNIS